LQVLRQLPATQLSVVFPFPSLQLAQTPLAPHAVVAVPATQAPLPSVHPLQVLRQLPATQLSVVFPFPSLQLTQMPPVPHAVVEVPATQTPASVHPPQLWTHAPALQLSAVLGLASSQLVHTLPPVSHALDVVPGTHTPELVHVVHVLTHAPALQLSAVLAFPSLQSRAVLLVQALAAQRSDTVQKSPSSQLVELGVCTQPPPTHASSVHGLVSSQSALARHSWHAPLPQKGAAPPQLVHVAPLAPHRPSDVPGSQLAPFRHPSQR